MNLKYSSHATDRKKTTSSLRDHCSRYTGNFLPNGGRATPLGTRIWYIYDAEGKTAFSYYDSPFDDDDDSYVTDMYGLTEWVASLKEKRISMQELTTYYRIIGL